MGYQGAVVLLTVNGISAIIDPRYIMGILIGGCVVAGVFIGPMIVNWLCAIIQALHRTPASELVGGTLGLVIGLIIAILITIPLPREIPIIGVFLPIITGLIFGYVGLAVGVRKKDELLSVFHRSGDKPYKLGGRSGASPKILDTSVIIDGRISDITKSGFLEGPLIVPGFVLEELQHIADSSDVLKRNRGRRGLDILNKIQKEPYVTVEILDRDYEDITEVDTKLVRLAKDLEGKVVTNDFNLNKVCELHGVPVLNINELANAVKPVVLPGEELRVHVIKDGKEQGQGVAYLDDGTMIVVDGGRRFIGETIGVLVTSVLQTAAGRMIFAKPKVMERAL
ncbi:MAG: twitching motility protein PilT [Peptococcaceae bacterium 1109]|nr:MAG: twitching motility protein PilT [Peptococcaceae bacterium 1109]